MARFAFRIFLVIAGGVGFSSAQVASRWVETIVPGLLYSPACTSKIELENLGERTVLVEVEAHRESGALAALAGRRGLTLRLPAGERQSFGVEAGDESTSAWVKVREHVPSPALSPVVAIGGRTECVAGNELRSAPRRAAFATRSPWYSDELTEARRGDVVLMINTGEQVAEAAACYSSGSFYAVPEEHRAPEFKTLCSSSDDVQVPPYGSREFPVERGGNTHFELKTKGQAIVLQMLRPSDPTVRLYTVDSTITFGSEATPAKQ